jgi:hypothetical protein
MCILDLLLTLLCRRPQRDFNFTLVTRVLLDHFTAHLVTFTLSLLLTQGRCILEDLLYTCCRTNPQTEHVSSHKKCHMQENLIDG